MIPICRTSLKPRQLFYRLTEATPVRLIIETILKGLCFMSLSPHSRQLVTTRHLNCYGVCVWFFFSTFVNLIIKYVSYSAQISHLAVGHGEGISLLVRDWLSQFSLR